MRRLSDTRHGALVDRTVPRVTLRSRNQDLPDAMGGFENPEGKMAIFSRIQTRSDRDVRLRNDNEIARKEPVYRRGKHAVPVGEAGIPSVAPRGTQRLHGRILASDGPFGERERGRMSPLRTKNAKARRDAESVNASLGVLKATHGVVLTPKCGFTDYTRHGAIDGSRRASATRIDHHQNGSGRHFFQKPTH